MISVRRLLGTTVMGVALASIGLAGAAGAAEIKVSNDITISTTWTANNTYNLQKQIYVKNGATLTIQAGTVIASDTNVGGSLAVVRGAKIFVKGTETDPVIFTSKADVATWVGGNPKTGKWREAANEWGNLTIMGRGYVSENAIAANTPAPNANNVAAMEGLVAAQPGDPNVLYGGGDDDDDSGGLSYVSFRYGGKVIGLGNELNGLSLGGLGRETDLDHIEIMNNVDDGIEIWGGTVNLKYFTIWNIGDDSLDVDQGWRGKAQFGLIVQGHSLDAKSGSGVCDNCFETDGAEDSDWQPVTTTTIYNCTAIGQPLGGDHATAWRDGARVQYRNCIFMDMGGELVKFDNIDGDGGSGYGHNGTLDWPTLWVTPYSTYSTVNAPANPASFYQVQKDGRLCEITDSVFYNNASSKAYTEATLRGVLAAANDNVLEPTTSPITTITRGPAVVKGGRAIVPVTFLDPRPAGSALTSVSRAPEDGFFHAAPFRGAFRPGNNWLYPWSASTAYGMTPTKEQHPWGDLGRSHAGAKGDPLLTGTGSLKAGQPFSIQVSNGPAGASCFWFIGTSKLNAPLLGGTLVPNFSTFAVFAVNLNSQGAFTLSGTWPSNAAGLNWYIQCLIADTAASQSVSFTNCILGQS